MELLCRLTGTLILWIILSHALAQVSDDFSDGDLTADPVWQGDVDDFKVNTSQMLQLDSDEAGASSLYTVNSLADSVEWIFRIKLSFSPSSNNNARVYLLSDGNDFGLPQNAYFLQFGEAGSGDAIELFRQEGQVVSSVCRGSEGFIATSFDLILRVTRSYSNEWNIYVKSPENLVYSHHVSAIDTPSFAGSFFFGMECIYTISNATKFYFDDIILRNILRDTIPPVLEAVKVASPSSLVLVFSEIIDSAKASVPGNYQVSEGVGIPSGIKLNGDEPWNVELLFDDAFVSGKYYTIEVEGIEDMEGNKLHVTQQIFAYYEPRPYDVLINEIMADVSPAPPGLPAYEYVEIYNRSDFAINLDQWSLSLGFSMKLIDAVVLPAGGYHVLCKEGCTFGIGISHSAYSSFNITNTGQDIVLRERDGSIQSVVAYSPKLYNNDGREEGGWSLERIDPDNPCGESGNWYPSSDPSGGSPGKRNTADDDWPDESNPVLWRVGIVDSQNIMVYFTETMLVEHLLDTSRYRIEPGQFHPLTASVEEPLCRAVMLSLPMALDSGIRYTLKITNDFSDCAGNLNILSSELAFQLAREIYPGGLLINEVLFNPLNDGVDFVEIFNPTEHVFDLADIRISSWDPDAGKIKDLHYTHKESYLVLPGDYCVLTTHGETVSSQYFRNNPLAIADDLPSFPSLANEEGFVAISDFFGMLIDTVYYHDDMHFSLLTNTDGISLERISPRLASNNRNNWHSASSDAGYATPGLQNSQYNDLRTIEGELIISPRVFSPDNDGKDDVLSIAYSMAEPGFIGNLMIFNSHGKMIRLLVNNQLLATEGCFFWDGIDDNNKASHQGFYIILLEVHDLKGRTKKFKEAAVLM